MARHFVSNISNRVLLTSVWGLHRRGMNEEQFRRWLQSWCVLNERNLKDAVFGFNSAMKLPDAKSSPEVGNHGSGVEGSTYLPIL